MNNREYRKDVEALVELYTPFANRWSWGFEDMIFDARDALKASSAMGWLNRFVPQFGRIIQASGCLSRNYITAALDYLVEVKKVFLKYNKNYSK